MEQLFKIYKKLLRETDTHFLRYLYQDINWDCRMLGIRGPRGVGKTTLMLQHIKKDLEPDDTLYVNADDLYFSGHQLVDLAEKLTQHGVRHLFIDEIHKYADWSKELKLIYDYYSELKVVFSGSSVLDLNRGASDLSRRAVVYNLYGLSFREYLALFCGETVPSYTIDDIVAGRPEELDIKLPLARFGDYLRRGYYPFATEPGFDEKLRQVIGLTMENDIPAFADITPATGRRLQKLLGIIARSVPFKPNMTKLAELTALGRNLLPTYFNYLEDAGMIAQLKDSAGGIRSLSKVEKVYLDNPTLALALAPDEANVGNVRETFFYNQTRVRNAVAASPVSDFLINGRTFEVGGKTKTGRQIANVAEGYVVKDDTVFRTGNILPLWWFGLNY